MLSRELIDAYKWQRQQIGRGNRRQSADFALIGARADVAAGKRRYPTTARYAAVCWQPNKPGLAYVDDTAAAGLRFVGEVAPSDWRNSNPWNNRADKSGYFTDPYGDTFRDGSGLCWGVVYQLPARNGKARFVAGYQFGGCDNGPTLDFSSIAEEPRGDWYNSAKDCDAARDAARWADSMAERAAEQEREYQTAWQAGACWADRGEQLATERKAALRLLAQFKTARQTFAGLANVDSLCGAIRAQIDSSLERIAQLRADRRQLANGDHDSLYFYASPELKAAFNDGAGVVVL